MRTTLLASLVALAVSGCALRPRYGDFVSAQTQGPDITFTVVDAQTNQPVPGAKVEVSELKNRLILTTDAAGQFKLPVEKKYLDENALFVVTLPKGVSEYRVEPVHAAVPVTPPAETPGT